MPQPSVTLDHDDERRLAAHLFNHVWDLLERTDRGPAEDDEMLHAAHASRHHWGRVGTPVNWARGEWQCARVYAVLGRSEPALHHGARCLALCDEHGLGDFDTAYAHEALARGYDVGDRTTEARRHLDLAGEAVARLTDDEERSLLLADLAQISATR